MMSTNEIKELDGYSVADWLDTFDLDELQIIAKKAIKAENIKLICENKDEIDENDKYELIDLIIKRECYDESDYNDWCEESYEYHTDPLGSVGMKQSDFIDSSLLRS